MNYEELVKALRHCTDNEPSNGDCWNCPYQGEKCHTLLSDAAAAIEALQAEVDKANKSADAYRAMYFTKRGDITIEKVRELDEIDCHFHSALIRIMYKRIEELEAQLPKRGEWVETEEMEWGIYPFKKQTCSVCDCKIDHIFMLACMDYFDDRDTVFHYCPNCGAKMEVQE